MVCNAVVLVAILDRAEAADLCPRTRDPRASDVRV